MPARHAARIARTGAGLRLARGPDTAARPSGSEDIDGALDGLVATVYDLVRDLAKPGRTQSFGGPDPRRVGATLRRKAVACVVVLAVLAFELVLVSWLVSNL
jgi:hypothetical protein